MFNKSKLVLEDTKTIKEYLENITTKDKNDKKEFKSLIFARNIDKNGLCLNIFEKCLLIQADPAGDDKKSQKERTKYVKLILETVRLIWETYELGLKPIILNLVGIFIEILCFAVYG